MSGASKRPDLSTPVLRQISDDVVIACNQYCLEVKLAQISTRMNTLRAQRVDDQVAALLSSHWQGRLTRSDSEYTNNSLRSSHNRERSDLSESE